MLFFALVLLVMLQQFVVFSAIRSMKKQSIVISRLDSECREMNWLVDELKDGIRLGKDTINELLPMAIGYNKVRADRINDRYVERSICATLMREAVVEAAKQVSRN